MTAIDKARELAAKAHERDADKRRHHDWMIARPGKPEFLHHFQPAQDAEWVAKHYNGCSFRVGRK